MASELPPLPPLAVEDTFDEIVRTAGGCRVTDLLPKQITFDNADYYFESEQVIAELKEIHYDANVDPELRKRISAVYNRHAESGAVPLAYGRLPIRIDLLPDEPRREIFDLFKRKLQGPVKKAAAQIKETQHQFNLRNPHGVLILVNEGSTFLSPETAFFMLHHLLNGQYSSIDHVLYCSINVGLHFPGGPPHGSLFWSDAAVEGRREVDRGLLHRLAAYFRRVCDDRRGITAPFFTIEREDERLIRAARFETPANADEYAFFVRRGGFYESPKLGYKYYCERAENGEATLWLLESYQHGKLIQAQFAQKLIYANQDRYREITDRTEIQRLTAMLRQLKRVAS